MSKSHKKRKGVVYSTNPNHEYQYEANTNQGTLPPNQQDLRVHISRKGRGGKEVTLITGFVGSKDALKELGKEIKNRCGTGGSAKDGEIIIQGNIRPKVMKVLEDLGYNAKQSGG